MPAVNWLNEHYRPSWDDVLSRLQVIKTHPGERSLALSVGDDDHLIAYYTEYGYLVEAHDSGDADFYALIDNSHGVEPISVWCAGDMMSRPQKAFVAEEILMQAVRYYFDQGEKDPTLAWEINNTI